MIYGTKREAARYRGLHPNLDKALELLGGGDFCAQAPGRYVVEEGTLFYNLAQTVTRRPEEGFFEAHRKFMDIHYVLEGEEHLAVSHISDMRQSEAYDKAGDTAKYTGPATVQVCLKPGCFAVCFPEDAHQALGCAGQPAPVRKIVFKVKIDDGGEIKE